MDVVAMPQLGETVTEGTITAWVKQVGDVVDVDDALFEVSTEKVDTEVPAETAGYLRAVLVAEGETVAVGTPVAVLTATPDEPFESVEPAAPARPGESIRAVESPVRARSTVTPDVEVGDGRFLSPVVRRLLTEHGLDPVRVTGSGRDGRITRADVIAAAALALPSVHEPIEIGDDDEVVDFSRARLATAEHMVRSLATAAHALVITEVDYAGVEAARRSAGLSYLPFVARAIIDALGSFPHLNASVDGERLVVHRRIHLGIAVDVDQAALVVPVVREADALRLEPLAAAVTELADQARRRRLPGDALAGGTFTLTNVGAYGTLATAPIINQPQVAICSTDGVRMVPVAVRTDDGAAGTERAWGIAVHPVGNLSLSFDHRAVDGAYAAAFLAEVRAILQTRDWSRELSP